MPALKKRKLSTTTQAVKTKDASPEPENTDAADAFRKFFESQFQPLDPNDTTTAQQQASDEFDEDGESDVDFDGFSEEDDESDNDDDDDESVPEVKVVEHADVKKEDVLLDKHTRKALLVRTTQRRKASYWCQLPVQWLIKSINSPPKSPLSQTPPANKHLNQKKQQTPTEKKPTTSKTTWRCSAS